jgi:hypothetical protein
MSNGQHTILVSDAIWQWARRRCSKQEGPATHLRNILIAAMAGDAPVREPLAAPKRVGQGKGLHVDCYHELLDDYRERNPGVEPPSVTPVEAAYVTICPRCRRTISPGDQIVVTRMAEWE